MAKEKKKPEYRLLKKWRSRGFRLPGDRATINERTFTQEHAAKIVELGLAWKYLEVVPSWERSDTKAAVKEMRAKRQKAAEPAADEAGPVAEEVAGPVAGDVTEVAVSEHAPVDGDIPAAEPVVKKTRKRKKKDSENAD